LKIIIAGAGKVGYNLAKVLSVHHDVTIIDKNEDALNRMSNDFDILPIQGDIENPETYLKLNEIQNDLFIAVTNSDEANIISLFVSEEYLHSKKKLIRLQNNFFKKTKILQKLGEPTAIYPLEITTKKVNSLLNYPKANNVKSFSYTSAKLISVKINLQEDKSFFVKKLLEEFPNVIAVAKESNKNFSILEENDIVKNGDLVYFFGDEEEIKKICEFFDKTDIHKIKRGVVYGATPLGIEISKALLEREIQVKLIEKSDKLCSFASEVLKGDVTVINSHYSSHKFFSEEGLKNADVFISTTENDEYNIVKCIEAQEIGIKKVISINNDLEYYNLMHRLGIVVVRGIKANAIFSILENIESNYIITKKEFCGGKGVLFMRKIYKDSPLIGKSIKAYPSSKNSISILVRDGKVEYFYGKIEPKEGDVIVAFAIKEEDNKIKNWIYNL